MKKYVASLMCVALVISTQPLSLVALAIKLQQPANIGQVSGRAVVDGKPLGNVTVRLRNIDTGQLVGTTTANAVGEFSFTGLSAGNFIVETVCANGAILGTSTRITLTAGAMAPANLSVGTSTAALAACDEVAALTTGTAGAAGARVGAVASTGRGIGAILGSTVGLVTLSAAAVGITAGVIAAQGTASGSQ